ncbi:MULTISPECIES: 50S ribosomal protein L24 [Sphingobacterium]|uniref:Large ribosomal subunit protein uL24 n=1 Tax=Sphingobacterium cellulitidis TaxID=1768011 RepID=A0A8H9G0X3_9SPHI|nr:large subunit ribosomal protein L24 [Sphingobacterium soli]OYD41370.1 50S ribosomal protein L24 [Sphingobacterium cellulitidis]OYD45868.1 50S ribosomal protein L24 [Sphingobacterium cellulitidis]GGE26375.1 50S ribosomal protein L24 [Sphingobacterium soli]
MAQKTNKTTPKIKIKRGDLVKVIAGNSKGKQGTVLEVIADTNRAIVEGANKVKKHTKPSAANPNGGIIEKEAAINISNLALIDPKTGNPTRVGRKVNADGKIVRYAKKSGEEIK